MHNPAFCAKGLAAMHFAASDAVLCAVQTNRRQRKDWTLIFSVRPRLSSLIVFTWNCIATILVSILYFIAVNINYFPSGSLYQLPIHCDLEISEISQFEYLNCFFSSWQIKER